MKQQIEYVKTSKVSVAANVKDGDQAVNEILEAIKILLVIERDILSLSGDIDDEGTNSLMSDYIREQEKLVWMLNSYMH